MASNRHLGRIIALQTLYEYDFRRASADASLDIDAVLARNIARFEATVDDKKFIEQLVHGVARLEKDLDEELQPIAPEWPIDQIARMDRVVLRMGLYELRHGKDVPPKVVINEAVELAKAFGSENSSKFVNGVLGTVLRQIEGVSSGAETSTSAQPPAARPESSSETVTAMPSEASETATTDETSTTQASTAVGEISTAETSMGKGAAASEGSELRAKKSKSAAATSSPDASTRQTVKDTSLNDDASQRRVTHKPKTVKGAAA